MKKFALGLLLTLLISGCSNSDEVIEISERFFVQQISDISFNYNEFRGRTIRYDGIFRATTSPETGELIHIVYRYVLGCCGPEGIIGFEVDLGAINPLADEAWVQIEGVLESFEDHFGMTRMRVALDSITELEKRGDEIVSFQ